MSENMKVTKIESEKARSFMGVRRNFSGGGARLTFCLSFSNCWRSVFPLRWFCTEKIFVLVSMIILGLSTWSFQWITNSVNYITNIQSYQNTNKITFHSNSFWFAWFFYCSAMLQVRENKILLRNSSGGPEYLRTQREHCWRCNANGRQFASSFLHYKGNAPCCGNNHKKRFVGSSSQVY